MIVTVTLNPALHVGYAARQVSLGTANLVSRVAYRAGGRGLAVARVLHTFGHDVTAAGLAGGAAGEMIRTDLRRELGLTLIRQPGRLSPHDLACTC